jgi:predicted dehydrogenase
MRFLVAGTGSIGKRHIRNLLELGVEVVAYRYRGSNCLAGDGLPPGVAIADSIAEAISSPLDAVVIANRTDQHMSVAITAARAGHHLFIEKPLANSLKDTEVLVEQVDTNNLVVEVGFMLRFHPNLRWMKSYLATGGLGELHYARAIVGQYLPDWRPDSDYRQGYSASRAWGGGVIFDLIHELDIVRWLLGEAADVVTMTRHSPALKIETEAIAQIGLRLKSEVLVQVHMDYLRPSYARSLEIVGSEGVLIWNYPAGTVSLIDRSGGTRVVHEVSDGYARNDMYLAHMRHFICRLTDGMTAAGASLNDGIEALKLALACHVSARERRNMRPEEIDALSAI